MKERCNNPKSEKYHHYGGKGVRICEEWATDFLSFYHWAIVNGHQNNLWIDRIDGNGHYEPGNCRWLTPKAQANNTTRNHLVTINGITKTMSEWADYTGLPYKTISDRTRAGFTGEAIINPIKKRGPKFVSFRGECRHLKAWAATIGMPYTTFIGKLQRGCTVEELISHPVS